MHSMTDNIHLKAENIQVIKAAQVKTVNSQ